MSTMMSLVKLPTFNGEPKEVQVWLLRFKAFACVHDFKSAVERTADMNMPVSDSAVIDQTTVDGKLQLKAKRANKVAMANLMMAFVSEGLMGLIHQSMDNDWPSGQAWKVIDGLHRRYVPPDFMSHVEMRQALNGVTMKLEDNPVSLFETLSGIKNRYQSTSVKVTDEELIATVLEKAPREYSTVLTCEQRVKGVSLALSDLCDAMNQLWRTMNSGNEESGKEVSLMSKEGVSCYKCGKKGHTQFECRASKGEEDKKGKIDGSCTTCGRKGHKAERCVDDPKNADKIPDWYKNQKAKHEAKEGETAMTSSDAEVSLMARDSGIPNLVSVLRDPNIWIADTGASVD